MKLLLERFKDKRWLRNDVVARYLELIFQDREDLDLIVGLQGRDHLATYYFQKLAGREDAGELPPQRFITFHLKNNNHFVLSAFEVKDDVVEVLYVDPMGSPMPQSIKDQYIMAFGGDQLLFHDASLSQQKDAIHCGVYLADNAEIVANSKLSLFEIAENKERLFKTLSPQQLQQKREEMVETLNIAHPDCYELAEDGAIQLVSERPVEVPKLTAKQYHDEANRKINALLDQGDLDADAFEAMFDAAVDAYQNLDTAHMLTSYGSTKLLAETVGFFKSADKQFSMVQKRLASDYAMPKQCAQEANELEQDQDFEKNMQRTSVF